MLLGFRIREIEDPISPSTIILHAPYQTPIIDIPKLQLTSRTHTEQPSLPIPANGSYFSRMSILDTQR